MKKLTILWTALALMTTIWTAGAQEAGFTITLNQNYTGAPAIPARITDAHGSLIGTPLPSPTRSGQVFNGWWTAATGGSRVLTGATGTKFTQNTTIFARWSPLARRTVDDTPANMRANFDWIKNDRHPREIVMTNQTGTGNLIFHQIFAGNGSINWAIRWQSNTPVSLQTRQRIAALLHDGINEWTRPLIGFEDWPFGEIPVTVVGWAVSDSNLIQDRQPNETIWVNNTHQGPLDGNEFIPTYGIASAPQAMSRFLNYRDINSGARSYPGSVHNRFDMYLWVTEGFGGAVGGDWGNRWGRTSTVNAANTFATNARNNGVLLHEIGHGFGLYDWYGDASRRPPGYGTGELRTIMDNASPTTLATYDQWHIRYYWNWAKATSPAARWTSSSVSPIVRTFDPANTGYNNAGMAQVFTITNTGIQQLANMTATLAGGTNSNFEIVTGQGGGGLSSTTINAPNSATVSIRPKAGLAYRQTAYTDTLRLRGNNGVVAHNIPLSFSVIGSTDITTVAAMRPQTPQFRFDNRGTLRYNLGGVASANLKIFDSRGRIVQNMILYGTQSTVNTNLNIAPQMLIWKVEAEGRVMEQGRMRFALR